MSQAVAHPATLPPRSDLHDRVHTLEEWRRLTVDPKLDEYEQKLQAFERIEQQITGVIRFFKVAASVVATVATFVEVTRFILTMAHLVK